MLANRNGRFDQLGIIAAAVEVAFQIDVFGVGDCQHQGFTAGGIDIGGDAVQGLPAIGKLRQQVNAVAQHRRTGAFRPRQARMRNVAFSVGRLRISKFQVM